jgi:hypothetical protein
MEKTSFASPALLLFLLAGLAMVLATATIRADQTKANNNYTCL